MKKINFISHYGELQSIIKGLTLCKSLMVSSLITGEAHTGKITLVASLFPNTPSVDAYENDKLIRMLEDNSELIIYNFEAISNIRSLDMQNKRIIAIGNYDKAPKSAEEYFAFIYTVPPLRERPDDVEYFLDKFSEKLKKELMINDEISIDIEDLDLSENFKSMKRSIYKILLKKTLTSEDIEKILFEHLYDKIEGKNSYRELLDIFEKPLIEAGLKKYKSQLKLADVLGLNRNTLRKKIHENDIS